MKASLEKLEALARLSLPPNVDGADGGFQLQAGPGSRACHGPHLHHLPASLLIYAAVWPSRHVSLRS